MQEKTTMKITREEAINKVLDGYFDLTTDGKYIIEKIDVTTNLPSLPVIYVGLDDKRINYSLEEVAQGLKSFEHFEAAGNKTKVLRIKNYRLDLLSNLNY